MSNARGQWENAFNGKDRFFTVRLNTGAAHKRLERGGIISRGLAKRMKNGVCGPAYTDCVNAEGAQVMLHGIGPSQWEDEWKWCPESVALEDLKMPSRTLTSLTNLPYYAIMVRYTPNQLYRSTFGKYADDRWSKKMVRQILARLADAQNQQTDWDTYRFPERLEEDFKANGGYWGSDAVPTINCWKFFYIDDDSKNERWHMRVILDSDQPTLGGEGIGQDFLYYDPEPYAKSLKHLLYITFANGAHVAPFRYHSVRGLGYRLYGPEKVQQRIQIRFSESVLQEMMWIFSNVPAEDRERLEMIYLHHMGVMPEGAKWVPANERYRPDLNLVLAGMNQNRQLMSESSASYIQDQEGGNARETATKTLARMNQANAIVSAFLNKAFGQKVHQYTEICRRFCLNNSPDPDVQKFREDMKREGVPDECLNVEAWDVMPEKSVGNGNTMLAAAMVDRLMAQFPRYDPEAQREILHIYTDVNSGDAALAEALVPLQQREPSPAIIRASGNFGSLMEGVPMPLSRGINSIEYAQTLLQLMAVKVSEIQKNGGMGDARTVKGLFNVGQEIARHIELISQDPTEKERVKDFGDALGEMMNLVKAAAQRLAEQAQAAGQQLDPELQAKIQSTVLMAQTNSRIKEAAAVQKLRQAEQKFIGNERRKDIGAAVQAKRSLTQGQVEAAKTDILTEAEIRSKARLSPVGN